MIKECCVCKKSIDRFNGRSIHDKWHCDECALLVRAAPRPTPNARGNGNGHFEQAAVEPVPPRETPPGAPALTPEEVRAARMLGNVGLGGLRYNGNKPRFSLISPWAMEGLARVLTYGAKKYTQFGECTCSAQNANDQHTREGGVEATTINGSKKKTLSTEPVNRSNPPHGQRRTGPGSRITAENEIATSLRRGTESADRRSMKFSEEAVNFVEDESSFASTTTMQPEPFEAVSVSPAMSGSAGSKNVNGRAEHEPTCLALQAIRSGADNWRNGLSWRETIDSLERHLAAFKKGEDFDNGPGGSDLPHIDLLLCNAMFLSEFFHLARGTDDRWTPPEK